MRTAFLKNLIILHKVFNLSKHKRRENFSIVNSIKILFKKLKTLSLKYPLCIPHGKAGWTIGENKTVGWAI